jgi:hypothetical protein
MLPTLKIAGWAAATDWQRPFDLSGCRRPYAGDDLCSFTCGASFVGANIFTKTGPAAPRTCASIQLTRPVWRLTASTLCSVPPGSSLKDRPILLSSKPNEAALPLSRRQAVKICNPGCRPPPLNLETKP